MAEDDKELSRIVKLILNIKDEPSFLICPSYSKLLPLLFILITVFLHLSVKEQGCFHGSFTCEDFSTFHVLVRRLL